VLPDTTQETTAGPLIGKFLKRERIVARELDGSTAHVRTPAGYQAIGVEPLLPGSEKGRKASWSV
jgi:hypothetical protein